MSAHNVSSWVAIESHRYVMILNSEFIVSERHKFYRISQVNCRSMESRSHQLIMVTKKWLLSNSHIVIKIPG